MDRMKINKKNRKQFCENEKRISVALQNSSQSIMVAHMDREHWKTPAAGMASPSCYLAEIRI